MKRILVLDDEPVIREITKKILVDKDIIVDTAPDAVSAQWMIEVHDYTLCLVDMKLPMMSAARHQTDAEGRA